MIIWVLSVCWFCFWYSFEEGFDCRSLLWFFSAILVFKSKYDTHNPATFHIRNRWSTFSKAELFLLRASHSRPKSLCFNRPAKPNYLSHYYYNISFLWALSQNDAPTFAIRNLILYFLFSIIRIWQRTIAMRSLCLTIIRILAEVIFLIIVVLILYIYSKNTELRLAGLLGIITA